MTADRPPTPPDRPPTPCFTGPDGRRLRWIDEAIEATQRWIEAEQAESREELHFSAPGDYDYDYNTDILAVVVQAQSTLVALELERQVILGRQALRSKPRRP